MPKKAGPKKNCPECNLEVASATMTCPNTECGYKWPKKERKPRTTKANGGSLKTQLNARLAELEKLLTSKDQWEQEKEQIEALLKTMG